MLIEFRKRFPLLTGLALLELLVFHNGYIHKKVLPESWRCCCLGSNHLTFGQHKRKTADGYTA
jgi:hypothetical protein